MSRDQFNTNQMAQSAVILQLTLIGESAKKVSPPTRESIKLPWREITGFRDRAVHDYYEVDLDIVWNTVIGDIPELKLKLAESL